MRVRHVTFDEFYDQADRIMDLNFYSAFKHMYKPITDEVTTPGGRTLKQVLADFKWDKNIVNYVRGQRPYPGGMDWIGAERIIAVMCIEVKHFVTLEIRLKDGVINAYDCNIPVFTQEACFAHLQPVLELLPI